MMKRELCLAIIGGRLEQDNHAIFAGLRERARGHMAVLATASQMPHEVGPEMVADLRIHGTDAELVPLFHGNAATAAEDPRLVAQIERLGAVYFTGGDQSTLLRALAPNGRETPVLAAIRRIHAAGGLIAGSSAGAAIMSRKAIIGGTSLEAVIHGVVSDPERPGLLMGPGLGFFPHGLVDQHFIARGRIGRLVVGMAHMQAAFGFGVDENTAMFVDGDRLSVVGEKGALVVNGALAHADARHRRYDHYRVSYLDDGDAYNLAEAVAMPHPSKKPTRRASSRVFAGPGYLQRSIFAPNVFDELITRLADGDSERYARDIGTAYDADAQIEVMVELERSQLSSASRVAKVKRQRRFTVLDYQMHIRCRALAPELRKAWLTRHTKQLMRGVSVAPSARVIAVGAALGPESVAWLDDLRALKRMITIVTVASGNPEEAGLSYMQLFSQHGIQSALWDGSEETLPQLASSPATLFTGGNQERLMGALFQQGEETALLDAVVSAYRAGGTLIAVGGSATALASAMISGGSSDEALLYGTSPDPWYRGVVVQEGIGVFREGLIDQHFVSRHRLGRLLVACLDEGARYGFGLPEEAGFASTGGGHKLQAMGGAGTVVLDLREAIYTPQERGFAVANVLLKHLKPGQILDTTSGQISGEGRADNVRVRDVLSRFEAESSRLNSQERLNICQLLSVEVDDALEQARFTVQVTRSSEARRAIREAD